MEPTNKRRILLIDDDQDVSEQILMDLEECGYETAYASNGEIGLQMVDSFKPHLVILDVQMPGLSGLEVLSQLRLRPDYISVILASGETNSESVTSGLDKGADDYLKKPYQMRELLARVRCQLRIKALRDELKISNEKLLKLASTDDLTGLANMRVFFEHFQQEVERAARTKSEICIMMIDMDNFKSVNDQADHVFGSKVLAKMGGLIRQSIRKTDIAARYGGDEFIVLLNPIDLEGAKIVAQNLIQRLANDEVQLNSYGVKITISVGFSVFNPATDFYSQEQMLRFADAALYQAKKLGRNRYDFKLPLLESNVTQIPQTSI